MTLVQVAEFDGPLGLLLSLIEARQLDVLTVPLGALADAYLDALATLEADRLGNISSFVAVASQLILIKSRRCCRARRTRGSPARSPTRAPTPRPSSAPGCILYRAHRDAGLRLADEAIRRIGLFRREPGVARAAGLAGARPADAPPLDPALLVAALDRLAAVAPPPEPPPEVMARLITLTERAAIIRAALRDAPVVVLQDLLRGRPRPGRDRHHVPGHAGADEASRDRGRAARAVGPDRRPRDDAPRSAPPPAGAGEPADAPLDESLESFA